MRRASWGSLSFAADSKLPEGGEGPGKKLQKIKSGTGLGSNDVDTHPHPSAKNSVERSAISSGNRFDLPPQTK